MLTRLQIRDFTLIDELELEFDTGLTVITGETGAGKSILVEALGLLLGDRADSAVIRHGCERSDLAACFALHDLPRLRTWLADRDLDQGDELWLRRIIASGGRSRAYINGSAQPLQALAEVGAQLVDIHGQHAHQSLVRSEAQRALLDAHASHPGLQADMAEGFRRWQRRTAELATLRNDARDRDSRLDLLEHQCRELDALGLHDGEMEELEREHRLLAGAGERLAGAERALGLLYEGEEVTACALASQARQALEPLAAMDPRLDPLVELLDSATIQMREAAEELRRYARDVDLDPRRLAWVDQRLSDIHALARKHRVPAQELSARHRELQAEREGLAGADERRQALEHEVQALETAMRDTGAHLSASRARAAAHLDDGITAAMAELGMHGGCFQTRIVPRESPAEHGWDRIEFHVSANPGQPVQPLARVASGGELARISLAIQVIAARAGAIPTLIFDEVDSGIGGGVAEVVGRLLRQLGTDRQVLCVTHLPQVAAQGHHHFSVSKETDRNATRGRVQRLSPDARVQELARMLGGVEMTASTLSHAGEMLVRAQAGP